MFFSVGIQPSCISSHDSLLFSTAKPLTPSKPRLVKKNTNSVTVTWSKNIWETNTITGYIVRYRVQGKTVWNEQLVKAPTMQFTYGSLRPYTYVEFQVIAVNDIGRSRVGEIDWFVSGEARKLTCYITLHYTSLHYTRLQYRILHTT